MQTKLDKAFKIIVDISNRKVTIPQAISWYVTDENIAHLNCQIIDEVEDSIIDIQSYKLSMRVLTPSRILKEVNYTLSDATNNIFTLTLPDELITEKGRHQCELSIEYLGDKLTSEPFNYNIIQSIANQLDSTISKDSHYPLVLELEDKLKEWNNILDEQVSKVIILDNDVRNAEKTRQANEAQRIEAENVRSEFYDSFSSQLADITHKVNIKEKMSKGLTATEAFKEAIKEAYAKSFNNTGWRSPLLIEIPSGEYVIEDTLIDASTGVYGGRFVFKGYGYQNTKILFQPVDKKYLFDNSGVFGFTVFEGIAFESNGLGRFMNGVGGGTGNSQGFIFEKCRFDNWDNIIYTTGGTMMSEVTFRDCRITGGTSDTVMFHMNNSQAVNWRFIATDIESFRGTMIELIQGTTITFMQGSIIPLDGTVISIPASANPDAFGSNNNPCIQMYGSRFELRGRSYLVKSASSITHVGIVFYNCGMGGYNLDTSTENPHYTLDLAMKGMIKFTNCYNLESFKMCDIVNDSSSFSSPKRIIFDNSDIDITSFIKNSTTKGIVNNALGCATIEYNGHAYKLLKGQPYVIPNYPLVTTLWKQNRSESLPFGYFSKTGATWDIKDFNYKRIYNIALIVTSLSSYGSAVEVPFRITNANKSKVFLEGSFKIQSDVRLTTETFTPYFIGSDDYLIFEIGEVLNPSASTLRFHGFIEITHQ